MKQPFNVLREDYNPIIGFHDVYNCPLAMAFRRQFPNLILQFAGVGFIFFDGGAIKLDGDGFTYKNYKDLGEGIEFQTQIEFKYDKENKD